MLCAQEPPLPDGYRSIGTTELPGVDRTESLDHPLQQARQQLEAGETLAAGETLQKLITELDGRVLFPLGALVAEPGPRWLRIDSPASVLGQWCRQLGDLPLPQLPTPPAGPWQTADPRLWHPSFIDQAQLEFEWALERGDVTLCQRIADSPNAPEIAPEVRAALASGYPWQPQFAVRETVATRPEARRYPAHARNEFAIELDPDHQLQPAPVDNMEIRGDIRARRFCPPRVVPHASDRQCVVAVHGQAYGVDLGEHIKLAWELHSPRTPMFGVLPIPTQAVRLQGEWLLPLGPLVTSGPSLWPAGQRPGWPRWQAYGVGSAVDQRPQTVAPWSAALTRELSHRFPLDAPLVTADGIYLLTTTGRSRMDMEVCCLTRQGQVRWRRSCGTLVKSWHAAEDLRTVLPEGLLVQSGDSLLVFTGLGWLHVLDASNGAVRSVQFYDSHTANELPYESVLSLATTRFRSLPAPRLRPPSPVWLHEAEGQRPLLVVLPAESRSLLGLRAGDYSLRWAHGPLSAATQLLGAVDGEAWLVDLELERFANTVSLHQVSLSDGRLAQHASLRLQAPAAGQALPEAGPGDRGLAALVLGRATLTRQELWLPTTAGVQIWELDALRGSTSEALPPARVEPWPVGVTPGSLWLLAGQRILCIGRGQATPPVPPRISVIAPARKN